MRWLLVLVAVFAVGCSGSDARASDEPLRAPSTSEAANSPRATSDATAGVGQRLTLSQWAARFCAAQELYSVEDDGIDPTTLSFEERRERALIQIDVLAAAAEAVTDGMAVLTPPDEAAAYHEASMNLWSGLLEQVRKEREAIEEAVSAVDIEASNAAIGLELQALSRQFIEDTAGVDETVGVAIRSINRCGLVE